MNDEQESESYGLIAWILGVAVAVALAVAIIPGILAALSGGGAKEPASAATPVSVTSASVTTVPAAAASSAAAVASAPAASAAPAAAAVDLVKLYFASGKVDLPVDATTQLKPIVDAVKAGTASKAVVSGFHDKTGSAEVNAELAKNRAFAVRAELTKAGLTEAQIELQKPQETEGGSNDREARRVEVSAVR